MTKEYENHCILTGFWNNWWPCQKKLQDQVECWSFDGLYSWIFWSLSLFYFFLVSTLLRKAIETPNWEKKNFRSEDEIWKHLMLEPNDYSQKSIKNKRTKAIMNKVTFEHGGERFDKRYPKGIPTQVEILTDKGLKLDSGLIMYPTGHSRFSH